jgi:hypothetical protein
MKMSFRSPRSASSGTTKVHLLCHTETIAANLQELAGGDQRLEVPLEAVALFPRHAQQLRELARRSGVMDSVLDEAEDGVAIQ